MAHRIDGHASNVKDAVDDVGPPDVISEGKDLPAQIAKRMIARLVFGAAAYCQSSSGLTGSQSLQLDDRDRPVGAKSCRPSRSAS